MNIGEISYMVVSIEKQKGTSQYVKHDGIYPTKELAEKNLKKGYILEIEIKQIHEHTINA